MFCSSIGIYGLFNLELLILEKSICGDLFMDVYVQGDMIERIEFNVGEAIEYVANANTQLKDAVVYQKSARKVVN